MKSTRAIVSVCLILVIGVFGIVFMQPAQPPSATGIEIVVESGEVIFEPADEDSDYSLLTGDQLTRADGATNVEHSDKESSDTSIEEMIPAIENESTEWATVELIVTTSANSALAHATGQIELATEVQVFRLNERGRWVMDVVHIGDSTIHVYHPSLMEPASHSFDIEPGTNAIRLTLATHSRLQVLVQNELNNPVAGAEGFAEPAFTTARSTETTRHTTNEDGLLLFDPLIAGESILNVTAEGYLPHEESVNTETAPDPLVVTMRKQSQVIVDVVDNEGMPIFVAHTTLQSKEGTGIVLRKDTSESTGRVTFDRVPPGEYEVFAEHRWYRDAGEGRKDVTIASGESEHSLTLQRKSYTISGRVVNKHSGEAIVNAEVVLFPEDKLKRSSEFETLYNPWESRYETEPDHRTRSDSSGAFQFSDISGGVYMAGASPMREYVFHPFTYNRNSKTSNPLLVLGEREQIDDVNLELLPSWSVSGRVLKDDRTPLANARILIRANVEGSDNYIYMAQIGFRNMRSTAITNTNTDGEFRFDGNADVFSETTRLYINADHTTFGQAIEGIGNEIKPNAGQELSGVEIVYEPKGVIRGTVTDEAGRGISGVQVNIGTKRGWTSSYTDAAGVHEEHLPPGDYPMVSEKLLCMLLDGI